MDYHDEEIFAIQEKNQIQVMFGVCLAHSFLCSFSYLVYRFEMEEWLRQKQGEEFDQKLRDAHQIEVGALEKLDDVVVTKNSLQTRLDVVEKEVKAMLESANDILALEKGAREELDQALTTHAKQLAQRQRREAELERIILLGIANHTHKSGGEDVHEASSGLLSTWLNGIGLRSDVIRNFKDAGIVSPEHLVGLDAIYYEFLGVTNPDHRRKLFYLVQQITNSKSYTKNHSDKNRGEEDVDEVSSGIAKCTLDGSPYTEESLKKVKKSKLKDILDEMNQSYDEKDLKATLIEQILKAQPQV